MRKNCTPEEMSYLATSFAVSVAKGQDIHGLRILCSFFTSVIATLNVIINQKLLLERELEKKEEFDGRHREKSDGRYRDGFDNRHKE